MMGRIAAGVPITAEQNQEKIVPLPREYVGKGKHMNCKISQSVNASVEGSLQWTGQIAKLQ